MKEDLDHVLRIPLPWRTENLTECGRDPQGLTTHTHDEFIQRCKELGKQRTAMVTCMTCLNTVQLWLWADGSLTALVGRELERAGNRWNGRSEGGSLIERELRAAVMIRSGNRCEIQWPGVCTGREEHTHHVQLRSRGGKDTEDNLLRSCNPCHRHVHNNPVDATARGVMKSRRSWAPA